MADNDVIQMVVEIPVYWEVSAISVLRWLDILSTLTGINYKKYKVCAWSGGSLRYLTPSELVRRGETYFLNPR